MNDQKCFCKCESLGFLQNTACLLSQLSTMQTPTPLTLHFSNKHTHIHIVTSTKKSVPSKILIKRGVILRRGRDTVGKAPIRG